jgi:hypothetical protein
MAMAVGGGLAVPAVVDQPDQIAPLPAASGGSPVYAMASLRSSPMGWPLGSVKIMKTTRRLCRWGSRSLAF